MRPRKTATLAAFSKRFNKLLDDRGFSPLEFGRSPEVARRYRVSTNAAKKWLTGDSWPSPDKLAEIVGDLDSTFDWLVRGIGPRTMDRETIDKSLAEKIMATLSGRQLTPEQNAYIFGELYDFFTSSGQTPTPHELATLAALLEQQAPSSK